MKNKKVLIASVIAPAFAAVSVFSWLYFNKQNQQQEAINNPVTDNHVTDKSQKLTDGQSSGQDKVITPTTTDVGPGTIPEKPTVTRAEMSGDYVRVSATFLQPSNGECVVTFEKEGVSTVSKASSIIVGPSYYTCNGFRVARSEFSQNGTWTVTVTHKANGQESSSEKRTVEVQ